MTIIARMITTITEIRFEPSPIVEDLRDCGTGDKAPVLAFFGPVLVIEDDDGMLLKGREIMCIVYLSPPSFSSLRVFYYHSF